MSMLFDDGKTYKFRHLQNAGSSEIGSISQPSKNSAFPPVVC